MGEIAEDLCDGTACQWCGQYFQDPKKKDHLYTHGHPVLCWSCWNSSKPKERNGLKKAKVKTV